MEDIHLVSGRRVVRTSKTWIVFSIITSICIIISLGVAFSALYMERTLNPSTNEYITYNNTYTFGVGRWYSDTILAIYEDGPLISYSALSAAIGVDGYPVLAYSDWSVGQHISIKKYNDIGCVSSPIWTVLESTSPSQISSVIGRDGRLLIVFYNINFRAEKFDLQVAHCEDIDCKNVKVNTVDNGYVVGWFATVIIAADGYPLITYTTSSTNIIKVAHCVDVACASAAQINTIAIESGLQGLTSMIGLDGNLVIVFTSQQNSDIVFLYCQDILCTSFNSSIIGNSLNATASVIVGPNGNPYILLPEQLVICGNVFCNESSVVALPTVTGIQQFLTDISGSPLILSTGASRLGLTLTRCLTFDCTTTVTKNNFVPTSEAFHFYTKMLVGIDGMPLVVAINKNSTHTYIQATHCDNQFCTAWKN